MTVLSVWAVNIIGRKDKSLGLADFESLQTFAHYSLGGGNVLTWKNWEGRGWLDWLWVTSLVWRHLINMSNSAHIDNPSFSQLPCNVPSILIDKGGILDLCYQFTFCSSISCSFVFSNLVASAAICMHHNSNLKLLQSKWRWKEAFMPLWNDQDEKVPRLSPGCIAALDWIGWCSFLAESPLWWRREWKV